MIAVIGHLGFVYENPHTSANILRSYKHNSPQITVEFNPYNISHSS